jgi:hypothetical protein
MSRGVTAAEVAGRQGLVAWWLGGSQCTDSIGHDCWATVTLDCVTLSEDHRPPIEKYARSSV